MTDKQMILEVCKRLHLKPTENGSPSSNEFSVKQDYVALGSGFGASGIYAQFEFDEGENLVGHTLLCSQE